MTTTLAPPISLPEGFHNGTDWLQSLGDVPLERVVFDPWPGFASDTDLIRFVDGSEKRLCELIDDTLVEKSVGSVESYVAALLSTYLNNFILPRKLGAVFDADTMMRVHSKRVRLPDVSFVRRERLKPTLSEWDTIFDGSPDLAVDVISRGNPRAEMEQKLREYFSAGTLLVWYIYPKSQSISIYTSVSAEPDVLSVDDTLTGGDVIPGFSLRVGDLFVSNT